MLRITDDAAKHYEARLDTERKPFLVTGDCLKLQCLIFDINPEPHLIITFQTCDQNGSALGPQRQIRVTPARLKGLLQDSDKRALSVLRELVSLCERTVVEVGDWPGGQQLKGKIAEDATLPDHLERIDETLPDLSDRG